MATFENGNIIDEDGLLQEQFCGDFKCPICDICLLDLQ